MGEQKERMERQIYLSKKLEKGLSEIPDYPLTTVIAPMGYGKSTAIGFFLKEEDRKGALVLRQSIYGDGVEAFWRGFRWMFRTTAVYGELQKLSFPSDENARSIFLEVFLDFLYTAGREVYCFIDDLHLIGEERVFRFLAWMIRYIPEHFHLILASRNRIFSDGEKLGLGCRIKELGTEILRLEREDLKPYCKKYGVSMPEEQLDLLDRACEGWFSAIYLNMISYQENKKLMLDGGSIYDIISELLMTHLPREQNELLIILGMVDEFTVEQACFLWGSREAEELLRSLREKNAFISEIPETGALRCHHMLKVCTKKAFQKLPGQEQKKYQRRMGEWYRRQRLYSEAMFWLDLSEDYEKILETVEEDKGYSLTVAHQGQMERWLENCPKDVMRAHPRAILVFMRRLYAFRKIPEMLRLQERFQECINGSSRLSEEEKGNLMGECEITLSFLAYNDIEGMSRHHRRACELMTAVSTTVGGTGSWTFGSPSVLMMYYREPGTLQKIVRQMRECMPYYYRVTGGHGYGAEEVTEAEAFLLRGEFQKMELPLQRARDQSAQKQQWGMLLCADILDMRRALFEENPEKAAKLERRQRESLKRELQSMFLNTLDLGEAFLQAVMGRKDKIPEWIAQGRLESALVLFPATPMMYAVYGQVLLAQGEYAKLIARQEEYRARYEIYPNLLCTLYLEIQLAGAYDRMGYPQEALNALKRALAIAAEDGLVLPFAENGRYIMELLNRLVNPGLAPMLDQIRTLYEALQAAEKKMEQQTGDYGLTGMEYKAAELAAGRLSNREIAAELGLSEGTVKQYLNRIYGKLGIGGNVGNKRRLLRERLFHEPGKRHNGQ